MKAVSRLFSVLIAFAIAAYGFMSESKSSILWLTVPASLFMLTAACQTRKNSKILSAVMVILIGVFLAMLSFSVSNLGNGGLLFGVVIGFVSLGAFVVGIIALRASLYRG